MRRELSYANIKNEHTGLKEYRTAIQVYYDQTESSSSGSSDSEESGNEGPPK